MDCMAEMTKAQSTELLKAANTGNMSRTELVSGMPEQLDGITDPKQEQTMLPTLFALI